MRIVKAFMDRFPDWKRRQTDSTRFIVQHQAIILVTGKTLNLNTMMDEDRYVMEVAKADWAGLSTKAATARFQAVTPCTKCPES